MGGGVLGSAQSEKSEFLGTYLVQREGIRNRSCTKVGPWELIYHLSFTFIRVLGAGQVTRGVFTAAHTCAGHICESPHIM